MSYQLLQGDCLEIMPTLAPQSIDAIICDPPYGQTACAWDSVIPFAPMWECIKRVIKPRGAVVLFGSQPFTSALVMSNPKWFKYCWVWNKRLAGNPLIAEFQPLKIHEDVLVFSDESANYHPIMTKGQLRVKGGGYSKLLDCNMTKSISNDYFPQSIIEFSNASRGIHPTQKPVDLMSYLIRTYTNPGATVLDFTMGSGTTGVACMETGRNFIGIEMDANYFAIAQKRIEKAHRQATGQPRQGQPHDYADTPLFAEVA